MLHLPPFFYVYLPVKPVPVLSLHCACFVEYYTYLLSFTFIFLLNQFLFCLYIMHVPPSFYVCLPFEQFPVLILHCACFVGCDTYLLPFTFLFLSSQFLFCLCIVHVLLDVIPAVCVLLFLFCSLFWFTGIFFLFFRALLLSVTIYNNVLRFTLTPHFNPNIIIFMVILNNL